MIPTIDERALGVAAAGAAVALILVLAPRGGSPGATAPPLVSPVELLSPVIRAGETPSDDPADWPAPPGASDVRVSAPAFVVPSALLPARTRPLPSNNNVALRFHAGRLYLAWRTAPTHFASAEARIEVISTGNLGRTWDFEAEVARARDVREPSLLSIGGRLFLYCFEAGTDPFAFEPHGPLRIERVGPGSWTAPEPALLQGEVPWDLKARGGRAYMTSYRGPHYRLRGESAVEVSFRTSADGVDWRPLGPSGAVVHRGGISEVAFELDREGELVAEGRNEDGEAGRFGSLRMRAPRDDLAQWKDAAAHDPERHDSPRMFRHGGDLYVLGRRDLGGPYDGFPGLSFDVRRALCLLAYSARPKRTTLYHLERATDALVPVLDLPSGGDTAFPSVVRLDADRFLVANYSSPLGHLDRSWIRGQTSAEGTQIYLAVLTFLPR